MTQTISVDSLAAMTPIDTDGNGFILGGDGYYGSNGHHVGYWGDAKRFSTEEEAAQERVKQLSNLGWDAEQHDRAMESSGKVMKNGKDWVVCNGIGGFMALPRNDWVVATAKSIHRFRYKYRAEAALRDWRKQRGVGPLQELCWAAQEVCKSNKGDEFTALKEAVKAVEVLL